VKNLIVLAFAAILFSSCTEDNGSEGGDNFTGEMAWSKSYGGSAEETVGGAVATPDGGMIVIGYTESNDFDIVKMHASLDIWLSRYDASGNLVWSKTIGGSQDDYGSGIIASADGNYVITGYSGSNDGDVPGNIGMHDFFVAKITGDGTIIWSKNYGFMSHDHAHKIIQTSDGGFFVAGYADYAGIDGSGQGGNNGEGHEMRNSASVLHGVGEYFGIKINATGDFQWFRYFGGTMNDRVNDIVEANDGGILMAGYSESEDFDITDSKGSYDYWVVKLHHDGSLHWKQNYGGSGIDQAFGIAKTDNNSYLIVGRSNSDDKQISAPKGNFDAWVVHINDHGELLWEKSFGGSDYDVATAIKKNRDGKFTVVGNTRGSFGESQNRGQNDFWIFGIDNFVGTGILWQNTFGGSEIDIATDVIETSDGFTIIGDSQSSDRDVPGNHGGNDLLMIKVR
jgi:hypothetical protein